MSIHSAGQTEPSDMYVWEDLNAKTFHLGVASSFDKNKITKALREYAIAGTLHLDHLAGLRQSSAHSSMLKRNVLKLSEVLCLSEQESEERLNNFLKKHEEEWKNFLESLSPHSFIKEWAQVSI
jgi:hypothetical protein